MCLTLHGWHPSGRPPVVQGGIACGNSAAWFLPAASLLVLLTLGVFATDASCADRTEVGNTAITSTPGSPLTLSACRLEDPAETSFV